ncbi:hypothetical protein CONLIGDRAFT_628661 [Coniochaeta ligniaria NRRL 30616]|uniref:Glutathione S-transferase n=1 Tax=Coniochaeta ligniaria NRRL 30616 TaxID=1408157 RepID=A0A1J7J1W7_9PEZI|nr:hypothetical protein CONLIGDRAFT_628661 [Coniochaeta ligniaria NRRL 30616]
MTQDQATIKVHWLNGSRAQSILFLLELLQVPYELEIYHRQSNKLAPPELTKIHPLGKSPVVTVTPPGGGEPIVLAETAFIVQYLSEHFGDGSLVPKRWKDGQEGKVGGETEEWMRYQYLMYYAEGSFMSMMLMYYVFDGIRGPQVPFFIRPLTRMVANQVLGQLVTPTLQKHFAMLNSYVEKAPYLAGGEHITGADVALAYPIVGIKTGGTIDNMAEWDKGTFPETYPKLWEYMERIQQDPAWQRSVDKIKEIEGKFSLLP